MIDNNQKENKDFEIVDLLATMLRRKKFILIGSVILVIATGIALLLRKDKYNTTYSISINEPISAIDNRLNGIDIEKLAELYLNDIVLISNANNKSGYFELKDNTDLTEISEKHKSSKFRLEIPKGNKTFTLILMQVSANDKSADKFAYSLAEEVDSTIKALLKPNIEMLQANALQTLDSLDRIGGALEQSSLIDMKFLAVATDNALKTSNKYVEIKQKPYTLRSHTSTAVYILVFASAEILLLILAYATDYFYREEVKNKLKEIKL